MILAVDPGVTNGIVFLDPEKNYDVIQMENISIKELYKLMATLTVGMVPKLLIIEEYKIYPQKFTTHAHSDVPTLRVIGALEFWAYCIGAKVVFQPPTVKSMGYRYLGTKPPADHSFSHQMDAYAHAVYYLVTHKLIENPALETIQKERERKELAKFRSEVAP